MERRELLKHVGVAAGAGIAGATGVVAYDRSRPEDDDAPSMDMDGEPRPEPRSDVPSRYTDEFETVVDAASAGADPSGEEPIDDFLNEHAGEDTLLTFRPGTYRIGPTAFSGFSKFGMVGIGDERPVLAPTATPCRAGEPHLMFEGVSQFLMEDIDVDFTVNNTGGAIQLFANGDVIVRNVELVGDCPEQIASMRVDLRNEDAEGTIENLVARDSEENTQLTGVYVGKYHSGTLRFQECEIYSYSDNGLYASSPGQPGGGNGPVEVVGGRYEDNNISNVRLGSTGSVARDVTINVSSPATLQNKGVNARGIRLRDRGEHVVEGCEITIEEGVSQSFGGVVFHPDAGSAEIRDTRIQVDGRSIPAIRAFEPTDSGVDGPLVEDVVIAGSSEGGYAANVEGRDGTVFRNCSVSQNGGNRAGIRIRNATDCRIEDTEITTTGAPIILENAAAAIRNTTIATPDGTRTIDSLDAQNQVVTP